MKIPLKQACQLLDEAWYVSLATGKRQKFTHNSYGCSGNPDENFLDLHQGRLLWRFIEKDNQEVVVEGQTMLLQNEEERLMPLVLFMEPNWLENLIT